MTDRLEPRATETFTLYSAKFEGLFLEVSSGIKLDMNFALKNGRSSYILFEHLVARLSGLNANSQGGDADLASEGGFKYEVKAFKDWSAHPLPKDDLFHTGASSTFGANNVGRAVVNPALKLMKAEPQNRDIHYQTALDACKEAGYSKNDYYVYTNTAQYEIGTDFSYMIFPTATVLENLDRDDPRLISRATLRGLIKREIVLEF